MSDDLVSRGRAAVERLRGRATAWESLVIGDRRVSDYVLEAALSRAVADELERTLETHRPTYQGDECEPCYDGGTWRDCPTHEVWPCPTLLSKQPIIDAVLGEQQ